jgi:predicted AAA+ superfamily ATPase
VPVPRPHQIRLDDLQDIDDKKDRIVANTRQFLAGKRANNVLLTGARGTGKSSLVKALLTEFAAEGLRLIEVDKDDLIDLPDIVELLDGRPSASSCSPTTSPSKTASPPTRRSRASSTARWRRCPTTC